MMGVSFISVFGADLEEDGAWEKHIIQPASETRGMINTAVANDWNGDGKMDVIGSFNGTVTLILGPDWRERVVLHELAGKKGDRLAGSGGCIHSTTMDVDEDGDLDFVGSNNTVFWLECPDGDVTSGEWVYRTVDGEIKGTHCLITGDVDGDGRLDLIANSGRGPDQTAIPHSLTWQRVPQDPKSAKSWKRHVFAKGDAPGGSHYTGIADVNGDGRMDISCAAKGGDRFPGGEWFAWWEQPSDGGVPWVRHVLATEQVGATNILPYDFDQDGVMDFAASRGHGEGVLWFRGPDFEPIEIDGGIKGPHSLALGDIDSDGTMDIATCGHTVDGVAIWYSNDGRGRFSPHVVGLDQGSYDLRLVDMDGDGDLDFLIAGHFSNNLVWFENPLTGETLPLQG
ncbi:MAG: VCBS repeat-containing protein [Verrucomicrobiota bacterium]